MKNMFFKVIYLISLVSTLFYSTLALTMQKDNLSDDTIINQLKSHGIRSHVTYIHSGYKHSDYKNFPTQPFLTLTQAEKINSYFSDNIIQFIELNDNYQYESILLKKRDVIDILFPTAKFENYPDGEHFFTLDEKFQPHHLNSVEEAWKQDCYLKVVIEQGKVIKIQKRPLTLIEKNVFTYWSNGNKQNEISEKLDLDNNVIIRYEVNYDQTGQRTKMLEHNFVTNYKAIMTYLYRDDVYSTMDIFNEKGIKVNHTIIYDQLGRVESQYLDESGKIVKTSNAEPDIMENVILPQNAIYRSLPMDFKRVSPYYVEQLINQMASNTDNTQADKNAITRAIFLGIKPYSSYYHSTPFPRWGEKRYKNYPHQFPMSLAEAEFQHPKDGYVDLVKVTIGLNYQYQTISMEKWQQKPLSLPTEQFKSLENGTYFFSLDNEGKITPLEGIEQAIILPTYVRLEKVMGKIDSIVQKTRIQKTLQRYEYSDNDQMHKQIFNVLESPIMQPLTIETIYDEKGVFIISQSIIDNENRKIAIFNRHNKDNIYGVIERFNLTGIKTNHIIRYFGNIYENQYLDNQGNIEFTTSDIEDKTNPKLYDKLPLHSDKFIQLIFNKYLDK